MRFSKPKFPGVPLGNIVDLVQYGSSALASSEPIGVPMLRMNNLQDDGWDLADLKYIQLEDKKLKSYRLQPGDILFNRTNSKELVGKCEVFQEKGDWVFASYLIRVRMKSGVVPRFVADFLNTSAGRLQIDRLSRQIIGMTNINSDEIRSLIIPLPPDRATQQKFVTVMDAARQVRSSKRAEASALLVGLDEFVLRTLRISEPARPRTVFALHTSQLVTALNAERYRGMQIEKALKIETTLSASVDLVETKCSPNKAAPDDLWDWIRIDDLPNQPWQVEGVRTMLGKEISGSFFEVREGDLLVARLGPTLLNAKIVVCPALERRTIASAEFLVLRCGDASRAEAVMWLLRSGLYREMMYARSRGATPSRFRLNREDLLSMPFPEIKASQERRIAVEAHKRRQIARKLQTEAAENWSRAKRAFEERLLGA